MISSYIRSLKSSLLNEYFSKSKSNALTNSVVGSSSGKCSYFRYSCFKACSTVILSSGSYVNIFFIKSMARGFASLNNSSKFLPSRLGSCRTNSLFFSFSI